MSLSNYTHMLPTYCEESEDDYTCAHHVGIGILMGKMIWSLAYTDISSIPKKFH